MTRKGVFMIVAYVLCALLAFIVSTAIGGPIIGIISTLVLGTGTIIFKPIRNRIEDYVDRNIDAPVQKCRIVLIGLGRSGKYLK